MHSNRKKIFLILILTVITSIFAACSGTSSSTTPEIKSGDYPPAPPALMQATLTKLDGASIKLNDYKGKVILVNVWATWCGPCRQEVPELVQLQNKHQAKGFEVIGLNLDEEETPEMIKGFSKEFNVNYEMLRGEGELFNEFVQVSKKNAIPQSFLIDREGKLLGVFIGGGPALKKLIASVDKVMER